MFKHYTCRCIECNTENDRTTWVPSPEDFKEVVHNICTRCATTAEVIKVACVKCGETREITSLLDYPDDEENYVCYFCDTFKCAKCGKSTSTDEEQDVYVYSVGKTQRWCMQCRRNHAFLCSHCGTFFPGKPVVSWDSSELCNYCFRFWHTKCSTCQHLISIKLLDDCPACAAERRLNDYA